MKKTILFTLIGAVIVMLLISACHGKYHIPEDILKNTPTKELAETVLNSPLMMEMLAFNSVQYGFERVSSEYNGLSELLNREDAGSELSAIYHTMDPAVVRDSWTDAEKGAYAFKIQHIETILAQERVLQRLSPVQRHDLLGDCNAIYEGKQRFLDVYEKAESTVWLMGKILQQSGYAAFIQTIPEDLSLQSFLSKGSLSGEAVREEIVSQARRYLAES